MSQAHHGTTAGLLGYPDDARLLLVNADDFGMYNAINEAVIRAFAEGIVRSTSLMVPCPDAAEAMRLLKEHPELPFGVHLSVVRDIAHYRWGPLAPRERVPSLLAEDGDLFPLDRMAELLARAKVEELEAEFRAQVETVLAAGLRPSHLDWHCLLNGGRADVFDMTLGLAREYGLALRIDAQPFINRLQRRGLPTADHDLLDSFTLDVEGKSTRYAALLRVLPAGLTAWAVHPGLSSADAQAIDPDGWRVRQTDLEFLTSPRAREIVEEEGIVLISYGPLQAVWQSRSP
ncbi:MAG: ChbG/HpnK family deacetylase [Thermomicrobiales bacterium]|nr:ChbG/HpnK family deacetylase [Thermomicrobiales bacterium]